MKSILDKETIKEAAEAIYKHHGGKQQHNEHSVYCLYHHFLAYTNQPHSKEIRQAYYHGADFNENADTLEPRCPAGCSVDSHDESWYESLDQMAT